MPRKKEIYVYSFNELTPKVQEKVLNEFRPDMFDQFQTEMLTDVFKERLKEAGLPFDDVRWSLSYSQGDGVAFYGSFDVAQYLSERITKDWRDWIPGKVGGIPVAYRRIFTDPPFIEVSGEIVKVGPHMYDHYNTMNVELDFDYVDDLPPGLTKEDVENLVNELEGVIRGNIKDLSKEFTKQGYAEIEYVTSDEYVHEFIEANEYEFDKEGSLI